jgi:Copper type II ascorbate-dependent monooxygenase, C-terminal domain
MKKIFFLTFISLKVFSQEITFNEHIAPIIHKNCTGCHQPDGAGPFNLISFEDVSKRGKFIQEVTQSRYMPPFPADRKFQHYKNERGLTIGEIAKMRLWVEAGMQEGSKEVLKQNWTKSIKKPTDLVLKMTKPYSISNENIEDFRFFNIPTETIENQYITGVAFKAGNKKLVHHSRIMVDTTQLIRGIDGLSEMDPAVKLFQTVGLKDDYLFGWVPGNDEIHFPTGMGRKLNAGSDIILNMHYAPSPKNEADQSEIGFYLSKNPVGREVKTLIIRENDISNQPFLLKANEKQTFFASKFIEKEISLISVMPHAHLLAKTFRAFAITPDGEAINLIKIDNWDFNWQMTYQFKTLLKIPAGSTILVEASYDNTSANPENANPKDVSYGWGTKDEMMNMVFYYVDYKTGDENIEQ